MSNTNNNNNNNTSSYNNNTSSYNNTVIVNNVLVNNRFEDSYHLFMKYKWTLKEHTEKSVIFLNPTNHCDEFILRKENDEMFEVLAPLWNSTISMSKLFNSYYTANQFACDKLIYFENKRNENKY
jgi:hypothetical protein